MSEWIKRLAEKYSEVNEKKLTGNQHKLDMDKDGDIDGDDFKHMRNKKKANEEEVVMNPKKDKKGKESENMATEAKLSEGVTSRDASEYHYDMADYHEDMHKHLSKKGTKEALAAAEHHKNAMNAHHDAAHDHSSRERSRFAASTVAHRRSEAANKASRGHTDKKHIRPSGHHFGDKTQYDESVAHEAKIDEISKDKVGEYLKKVPASSADAGKEGDTMKFINRRIGAKDAVRKLTGKARVPATESTIPTVYSRILEERAKHYKGATKPEDWNEKEKNNKGAMDMKKDMAVDTSNKISNYDDLGHDDASKAGRITNAAKSRPGDNAAGDKKVVNPVKGTK